MPVRPARQSRNITTLATVSGGTGGIIKAVSTNFSTVQLPTAEFNYLVQWGVASVAEVTVSADFQCQTLSVLAAVVHRTSFQPLSVAAAAVAVTAAVAA